MNPIAVRYLQLSCAFGAGFTAVHGYMRRDHRLPTLNPLYHSVGFLRDGMLGAIAGPFLLPYALVADYKHCPVSSPNPPSNPPDISHVTL